MQRVMLLSEGAQQCCDAAAHPFQHGFTNHVGPLADLVWCRPEAYPFGIHTHLDPQDD